jgi:LacI family transcriptional regulator
LGNAALESPITDSSGELVVKDNGKRSNKATIIDIAKLAGVSYSTVSRVANNYEYVNPNTRERVLAAMKELHYVANPHARSLLSGASHVLGLLVHTLGSEYIGEIFRGIEEELAAVDYDLTVYTTHRQQGKETQFVSTITRSFAEGLFLVVPMGRENYLQALHESNFPHVLVDEAIPDGKSLSVGITNREGVYEATRYLLDLNHRRIGFISDLMNLNTARERLKGYQQALEEFGVVYDPELVCEDDFVRPQPRAVTQKLLILADPPTAILTSSDPIAIRVMETLLHEYSLRVPEDISIVGFDDIPMASLVYPHLTTVRHPLYEMGRTAAKMLLERIQDSSLPARHIELKTELVIRESCRPLSIQRRISGDSGVS